MKNFFSYIRLVILALLILMSIVYALSGDMLTAIWFMLFALLLKPNDYERS